MHFSAVAPLSQKHSEGKKQVLWAAQKNRTLTIAPYSRVPKKAHTEAHTVLNMLMHSVTWIHTHTTAEPYTSFIMDKVKTTDGTRMQTWSAKQISFRARSVTSDLGILKSGYTAGPCQLQRAIQQEHEIASRSNGFVSKSHKTHNHNTEEYSDVPNHCHTCMHTHIHMYIHRHAHTHTHTCTWAMYTSRNISHCGIIRECFEMRNGNADYAQHL